jgi:hypothetical protein
MSTTEKRLTIAFTREQLRELMELSEHMGETPSMVVHRAVTLLHRDVRPTLYMDITGREKD